MALRFLSATLGVVTVWLTARCARLLFPERPQVVLCATALVALLPMHAAATATVNNDVGAEVLATLTVYLLVRCVLNSRTFSRFMILILTIPVITGGLLTKRTTNFLLLLFSFVFIWMTLLLGRWRRLALALALLAVAIAIALLGVEIAHYSPWIGPTHPLTTSEVHLFIPAVSKAPLRPSWLDRIAARLGVPDRLFARLFAPWRWQPMALHQYAYFGLLTFASWWGNFGWMHIPMDPELYGILAAASLLALAGLLKGLLHNLIRRSHPCTLTSYDFAFVILGLSVILVLIQAGVQMVLQQQPQQGRYLFPALMPTALLFARGLAAWMPEERSCWPGVFITALIGLDLLALAGYILPAFYG